ncbi:hypothetical protein ALC62_08241, partial [Cyphomyrmex costatus]
SAIVVRPIVSACNERKKEIAGTTPLALVCARFPAHHKHADNIPEERTVVSGRKSGRDYRRSRDEDSNGIKIVIASRPQRGFALRRMTCGENALPPRRGEAGKGRWSVDYGLHLSKLGSLSSRALCFLLWHIAKANECMVGTLTLAANDADLRSWSKVALQRKERLNAAHTLLTNDSYRIHVGGIVGLFSWKRGKRDNDP